MGQAGNEGIPELLGGDLTAATTLQQLLPPWTPAGSTSASWPPASRPLRPTPSSTRWPSHPDRLRVALVADRPDRPVRQSQPAACSRPAPGGGARAGHAARPPVPAQRQAVLPVYATCAELGLPVSVNVGIPGPRVRSACQHPELLEDVLIDFKGLTVIGAHMGHPYEALLMQYMLKWPDLYLSNSAYLAKYMDPALVSFMDSSRGMGRVLYASDHPFLPMERAVVAARDLPLSDVASGAFLGGTAARLLGVG